MKRSMGERRAANDPPILSEPTLHCRPMIDPKALRENPSHFIEGARKKGVAVDIDRLLALDASRRDLMTRQEALRAQQRTLAKTTGPEIGKLSR